MGSGFWCNIENLTSQLRLMDGFMDHNEDISALPDRNLKTQTLSTNRMTRDDLIATIESTTLKLFKDLSLGEPLCLSFSSRRRRSTEFDPKNGLKNSLPNKRGLSISNLYSLKKFVVTAKVLSMCYKLIQANKFATKRELFYMHVNLFQSQRPVDDALIDLSCFYQVPRSNLHVIASAKGSIMGCLTFNDENGNAIQCNAVKEGVPVPNYVDQISEFSSDAKFILVVEKEAIYQKLADEGFARHSTPCIIITGRGFPDLNSRLMVRKLWSELKIPVFGLFDADPHGIEIMCVYRFGSMSMSYDSKSLSCMPLRWLGIHPYDIERFSIPSSVLIPMTHHDRLKLHAILKRPFFMENYEFASQMSILTKGGVKAEIECLDALSPNFLCNVYLPYKLRCGYWM